MKTVLGLILLAVVAMPVRTEELNVTDGNYLLGSCQITVRKLDNPDTTHDIAPLKTRPKQGLRLERKRALRPHVGYRQCDSAYPRASRSRHCTVPCFVPTLEAAAAGHARARATCEVTHRDRGLQSQDEQ